MVTWQTSPSSTLDKLDCAINAYGCVMMELNDDPERDDKREVDTIKWLYEVLRDEAHNVRGYLKLLDKTLNPREAA